MNDKLKSIVKCPCCGNTTLTFDEVKINCGNCNNSFPICKGIPILLKQYENYIIPEYGEDSSHKTIQAEMNPDAREWRMRQKIFSVLKGNLVFKWLFKKIFYASYSIQNFVERNCANFCRGNLILDAGAGECIYKKYFDNADYIATDLGVGSEFLDYTKVDFLSDLENIPIRDDVFDGIICSEVLEHTRNPKTVFDEFFRIMASGGKLILTVPSGGGIHQPPHHYYGYTKYGLEYLATAAGFNIVSIESAGGYFKYIAQQKAFLRGPLLERLHNSNSKMVKLLLGVWLGIFIVLTPIQLFLANFLDPLDIKRNFTLGYFCIFEKK